MVYGKIDKYKICIDQVIVHDFCDLRNRNTKQGKKLLDFLYALASLDFTLVGIHYKCARSADRMTFGGIIQTDHASVQADQC